jgi:transposase
MRSRQEDLFALRHHAGSGAVKGDDLAAYLEQVLCPLLRPAAHCVVMNNLAARTVAGVRLLYLPAYSPDLNPSVKCWAQFKQYVRAANTGPN